MKTNILLLPCCLLLTSCADTLSDNPPATEPGQPVSIVFEMYSAPAPAVQTRAEAVTTEPMTAGKTFRIYAYNSKESTSAIQGSEVYTINKDGITATGNLHLYQGTYNMYLVSYNSDNNAPALTQQELRTITVQNDHDFMYTTLENIVVKPEEPGGNAVNIKLPSPFKRLGSQVVVRVAAKNGTQPIAITTLDVTDIKVNGLPPSLDFKLESTTWNPFKGSYNASYTYPKDAFARNTASVTDYWTSKPAVLLPVDGSAELKFDVNLCVTYDSGTKKVDKVYQAAIQKVLLPGMTYVFDFTLTFYGEIIPSDLTLAVKEYNTITLNSDELGK